MKETWRWFGPNDPVTLDHVRQAGASGIVTALHHRQDGSVWPAEEIAERKAVIEGAGLAWSVVESIPLPDAVKIGGAGAAEATAIFAQSLRNVAAAGVTTVCYNFMPVVDWTRTNLMWRLPTTGYALRFDAVDMAAYDAFILKRRGAEADHRPEVLARARDRAAAMSESEKAELEKTIIAGLPGVAGAVNDRAGFERRLAAYAGITADDFRASYKAFLSAVVPVAEEVGARLAVHPDDPPFPLFGLPRIVSTPADARAVLAMVDRPVNGLTLCVGSYGSRADNDLAAMAREFAPRIHFAHLRNVTVEADGSFFEDEHLEGGADMVAVIDALMAEERARKAAGRADWEIPMRPDHGHLLADDVHKKTNPGYSLIGRLKGLAELRGVARAIGQLRGAA
ncbi:mannonate dehydratase [Inquilinus limosus]|uniref:Mannonate dehydratase n=1 Tax=Inquilinus limosus MP06 TaxID=1398085 RepID=A0A0A0D6E2_9PROT|nr:mannonate dehydratase [Inquilinus limosus]KGM33388.1 mannonate dehydratase [Inquilinus limosus MP06]